MAKNYILIIPGILVFLTVLLFPSQLEAGCCSHPGLGCWEIQSDCSAAGAPWYPNGWCKDDWTCCECSTHSDCDPTPSCSGVYECQAYYSDSCDGCMCSTANYYFNDESCTNLCDSGQCVAGGGACLPCECSSGDCCDGCFFKASGTDCGSFCDTGGDIAYKCSWQFL